ncbi:MAG: fatty acid desaturase, partial [Bdellovibrionales bacterium]|nr:fatty acid desaturase [Bdellovibrionales bacterium]
MSRPNSALLNYAKQIASEQRRLIGNLPSRQSLDSLQVPGALSTMLAFSLDWVLIVTALFMVHLTWWALPLTLIILGSRQRAFSNLIHDAAHGNLLTNRKLNDGLTTLLAALPNFDSVRSYRSTHISHHAFLGAADADPDSKNHEYVGYKDANPMIGPPARVLASLVFNRKAWLQSIVGGATNLSRLEWTGVVSWFAVVGLLVSVLCSFGVAAKFIGLWIVARATSYHLIRIFAEYLDHAGLKPGSILGFTRNIPEAALVLRWIFHPHSDIYHLAHHLAPSVP